MGLSGPTRPHGWCAGRVGVGCLWQPAHLDPNFDPNPDELRRPQAHLSGRMGPFLISKRTPADGPKRIRGICKTAIPGSIPGVASSRLENRAGRLGSWRPVTGNVRPLGEPKHRPSPMHEVGGGLQEN